MVHCPVADDRIVSFGTYKVPYFVGGWNRTAEYDPALFDDPNVRLLKHFKFYKSLLC